MYELRSHAPFTVVHHHRSVRTLAPCPNYHSSPSPACRTRAPCPNHRGSPSPACRTHVTEINIPAVGKYMYFIQKSVYITTMSLSFIFTPHHKVSIWWGSVIQYFLTMSTQIQSHNMKSILRSWWEFLHMHIDLDLCFNVFTLTIIKMRWWLLGRILQKL